MAMSEVRPVTRLSTDLSTSLRQDQEDLECPSRFLSFR